MVDADMHSILSRRGDHRARVCELRALAEIQAELLKGARRYFDKEGFTEIIVPRVAKATGACENVDTLFEVRYLRQSAYLMQTAQLFLEALTPALEKVWCCGPSFRAEARIGDRHLLEFTLLEMEFCGDFEHLLFRIEDLLSEMIHGVLRRSTRELNELSVDTRTLQELRPPFPRITYDAAVQDLSVSWGNDLESEHERLLLEKYGNRPFFVTHYPERIKFFNMKTNPNNPKVVNSADLILPFSGETAGGAEREFEYEKVYEKLKRSHMLQQLKQRGRSIDDFEWYLSGLRDNRSVQHAGCGIGINRLLQFILGSTDIRDSTLFSSEKEIVM